MRILEVVLDAVDRRLATTRTGEDAAIAAYLHDLETDPDGTREAGRDPATATPGLRRTLAAGNGGELTRCRRRRGQEAQLAAPSADPEGDQFCRPRGDQLPRTITPGRCRLDARAARAARQDLWRRILNFPLLDGNLLQPGSTLTKHLDHPN